MSNSTTVADRSATGRQHRARHRATVVSLVAGAATIGFGAAVVAIGAIGGSLPLWVQLLPWVGSLLVLGLPHGAVDHLVLPRARGEPVTGRSLATVGVCYLAIGGVYALFWVFEPVAAFVLFVLATLGHWGQGDVYVLVELVGTGYLDGPGRRLLALVVRGGLPMIVPLLAFPDQYAFVAETLVGLFDPATAGALDPLFRSSVRLAIGLGFGLAIVATLGGGLIRSGPSIPWLIDTGETLGLVAFFALVPPVLAIGLYFCLWHSVRHILRTMLVDDRAASSLARGALGAASRRFVADAAPLTAGGLVVLGAIALLVPQTPATVEDVFGLYLVTIAVLTAPHVVVVLALDREQGLWTRSRQ